MARPLHHLLSSFSHSTYAAMTLLFCAYALFMCASHSRKWRRWKACFDHGYYYDRDPVIVQLDNQEVIHGFRFGNEEGIAPSGEISLWQKNILMGGKCQLPDFSGVIIYDSTGNVVPPARASRALPCK
ncbi:hypothetical protein Vadar_029325 [Vaccinium darrowii]|uniref:Uncharacterized protein n=1 Tax=Vaccinium darrowii TaxID=229202 RepID=A0ACB7YAC0_9ERIC|nr:hypothetical protein Vadar_029325 [Vaccinium darrowii]